MVQRCLAAFGTTQGILHLCAAPGDVIAFLLIAFLSVDAAALTCTWLT